MTIVIDINFVTAELLELVSNVQSTNSRRCIDNHQARIVICMAEKANNFLDEPHTGSGRYRDKVNIGTNIIYEDPPPILEQCLIIK